MLIAARDNITITGVESGTYQYGTELCIAVSAAIGFEDSLTLTVNGEDGAYDFVVKENMEIVTFTSTSSSP